MDALFGIPTARLALALSLVTLLTLAGTAALALRRRILLRLGARNLLRRPLRSLIIVVGLALSTVVIATAFSTGDAMTLTLRSLISGSLGQVDEVVTANQFNTNQLTRQRLDDLTSGSVPSGAAGYFPATQYERLYDALRGSHVIVGLTPAILEQATAADGEAQQARSNVGVLAIPPDNATGFAPLKDGDGRIRGLADLGPSEVYVNAAAAKLLSTDANRLLRVYVAPSDGAAASTAAVAVEHDFTVRAVLTNGALGGAQPTVFLPLADLQQRLARPAQLNEILVVNRGGADSVTHSREAALELRRALMDRGAAESIRQALVSSSGRGELARIERRLNSNHRAQLLDLQGTAERGQVNDHLLYLLGDPYVSGVLWGAATYLPTSDGRAFRTLRRLNPLHVLEVKQGALDQANDYGSILTSVFAVLGLFSIAASVLLVFLLFVMLAAERRTEMGMARAVGLRRVHLVQTFTFEGVFYDLASALLGVGAGIIASAVIVAVIARTLAGYGVPVEQRIAPQSLVIAFCLGTLVTYATMLISAWHVSRVNIVAAIHGLSATNRSPRPPAVSLLPFALFPIAAGYLLMLTGQAKQEYVLFALGVSLLIVGGTLLLRRLLVRLGLPGTAADRFSFTLAGLGLIVFWSLPPSFFDRHGRRLLYGGIETFGLAGCMMVLGAVWITTYNLSDPLQLLLRALGRGALASTVKMAVAYPLQHRFRTGMAVAMFSLVIFTMIVSAVLLASAQRTYAARQKPPSGYEIRATAPDRADLTNIEGALAGATAVKRDDFAGVGSRASFAAEGIEPTAPHAAWQPLTVQLADQGLVQTTHLRLSGRARGYGSDTAVWEGLLNKPGAAVVARGSLPIFSGSRAGGLSRPLASENAFSASSIWVRDMAGAAPVKLTIIGVVDDPAALPAGIMTLRANVSTPSAVKAVPVNFLFKVKDGGDPAQAALGLDLSFGGLGLKTHVVGEGLHTVENISQLLNFVLEGFVGLGLVAGMAALGVISTRAVVERRQQIGMLRAIGMHRRHVQASFVLEASFTAWLGIGIGVVLGLLLAHSVVDFLGQNIPEMQYAVPWPEVGLITTLAYLASLASTLFAAWQAGRVAPAEALRYE